MDGNQEAKATKIIEFPNVNENVTGDSRTVLDWARYYVFELGFSVIPIWLRGKTPAINAWKEFQSRKPSEEELFEWFGNGDKNIGIITGSISGITIVDADTEGAVKYCESVGLENAPRVKSSKGYHYYCHHVDGIGCAQDILKDENRKIDIRGEGGYIIAPPSIHETGVQYKWEEN